MYVVKVGDYYVKSVKHFPSFLSSIELSPDMMRNFDYMDAKDIADRINGLLIPIEEEITISVTSPDEAVTLRDDKLLESFKQSLKFQKNSKKYPH